MATKFFLCKTCGNVVVKFVDSGVNVVCCGQQMQELSPSTEESSVEKHLPVVECQKDGSIKVKIGSKQHPMTPEHHISFICMETEHGVQVKYLMPDEDPEAVFRLGKDKPVAVYAYCNIHGLWKADVRKTTCCTKKSCCGFLSLMLVSLLGFASCKCNAQPIDNTPVKALELGRYLGDWYEIARYDHSFERGLSHARANYRLNNDGTVIVTNSGHKNGKMKTSVGKAKLTGTAGLLRVSFFGPFYSDYRVMMLSDDYNYALVGSGSSKYLWILSRFPEVPKDVLGLILSEATRRGYSTDKLIWVAQN